MAQLQLHKGTSLLVSRTWRRQPIVVARAELTLVAQRRHVRHPATAGDEHHGHLGEKRPRVWPGARLPIHGSAAEQ